MLPRRLERTPRKVTSTEQKNRKRKVKETRNIRERRRISLIGKDGIENAKSTRNTTMMLVSSQNKQRYRSCQRRMS